MNSYQIKHALLSYYRFKRQWLCASECMDNDIMAFSKNKITEVEIKTNKYDLWKGEARKRKHGYYKNINNYNFVPNLFYICVSEELETEAIKWAESVNENYGVMICRKTSYLPYLIYTLKRAKPLHKKPCSDYIKDRVMKRICSENINLIGRILNESNHSR